MSLMEKTIVAIGDIHGRADLLRALLAELSRTVTDATIVFLGDLIDRGPSSSEVLDMVHECMQRHPDTELILGNHDFYLRECLRGNLTDDDADKWVSWGGVQTLESYSAVHCKNWKQVQDLILFAFPHHLELLNSAKGMVTYGDYCFVHAGIRPGVSLSKQTEHDLMWIRHGFLEYSEPHPLMVVHGHSITPSKLPEVHPNRIAIDTGAYGTGRLTGAIFEQSALSYFLCTEKSPTGTISVGRHDVTI
jgi:serine/threonine protein phosphatase 1